MKKLLVIIGLAFCVSGYSQELTKEEQFKVQNSIRLIKSHIEPWDAARSTLVQPGVQKVVTKHSCGSKKGNLQNVVIVVDGIVKDIAFLQAVNPNDIESVSILKGASAIAVYGEKAKEGAIIVTMKCKEQTAPTL